MSLQKTVVIKVRQNEYHVVFPNTGQFLDIRSMKSRLVDDIRGNDPLDGYANLLGEMAATYSVLIPELKKDINVESVFKLSMVESKELLDTYTEVYKPFFDEWMNILMAPKASKETAVTNA